MWDEYYFAFIAKKKHFICFKYLCLKANSFTLVTYTEILEVNLHLPTDCFMKISFHSTSPVKWREIFMKQSVGKCKSINF